MGFYLGKAIQHPISLHNFRQLYLAEIHNIAGEVRFFGFKVFRRLNENQAVIADKC